MKRSLIVLSILALVWSAPLVAGEKYALGVDGLACPFCAYGIEKRLATIEGVDDIQVDIETGQVIITMAAGKTLDEAATRRAIKDAGFSLRSFEELEGESQ